MYSLKLRSCVEARRIKTTSSDSGTRTGGSCRVHFSAMGYAASVVGLALRAVAASRSTPARALRCAARRNITRACGMPSRFQSLMLGMERPKMRDTFAVPPKRSIISVAATFMGYILAQAKNKSKPKLTIKKLG